MSNEETKRIIEDSYDESSEDTLRSMARDFYSRPLLPTAILVWGFAILFLALAAFSVIQFFKTDQTRWQLAYAALFICGAHGVGLMKIFAWEMVHRHSIKRAIKRLAPRVTELSETLKTK